MHRQDLALHMATGGVVPAHGHRTGGAYSAVCPDGLVTGLRVLSRQDLALHMATGGVVVVHSHRTGGAYSEVCIDGLRVFRR